MINLLDDALFAVSRAKERVVVTLPEVVVGLATGHVSALHGINAVQRQFVWRLLVRCAAHAAERDATLVYDAEGLREFLASTTPDRASWDLYRDDSGPAFLQVPLGAATANDDGYKREDLARLTIVPGDKNHEFKRGVSARLCPSDALTS